MYNIKRVLQQEPATVSAAVLNLLGVAVILDIVNVSDKATAVIGMAVTNVLSLFYVRTKTVTKDYLAQTGQELP